MQKLHLVHSAIPSRRNMAAPQQQIDLLGSAAIYGLVLGLMVPALLLTTLAVTILSATEAIRH